jgi:hypothetical protein
MTARLLRSILPSLLLGCALAGACSGGSVAPTESEQPGTIGAPPSTVPTTTTPATPARDSVWEVEKRGVPRVITADYIELDSIGRVSLFRSSWGHDYRDSYESCRSMKHYFVPKNYQNAKAITIRAPLAGQVTKVEQEWAGVQLHIRSDSIPALTVILFHVTLSKPLQVGDRLTSGQAIGTHVGPETSSDVAVSIIEPKAFRLVSYFDAMTDDLFARYAARGVPARSSMVITREQRDADPISCDGERFLNAATLPVWMDLK